MVNTPLNKYIKLHNQIKHGFYCAVKGGEKHNMKNVFNSVFEIDETYESNNWIKVKIRTFAFGRNRNGSDILNSSLTDFSKAKKSIGAVPVVARYNDESDDLEGHNVTLRRNKNDEPELYHGTDPLGFTAPSAGFYFEEVNEGTEEESDYKTYVVVEDVYLWKRFDATKKIIEWFKNGIAPRVSMEIDHVEGQFDNDGYFQIHDFEFTGIAALGTETEPCFKKAEIQLYAVNEFKDDLKALMSELGNYSVSEGGNETMSEKEKVEKETSEEEAAEKKAIEAAERTEDVNKEADATFEDESGEGESEPDVDPEEPEGPEVEPEEPEVDTEEGETTPEEGEGEPEEEPEKKPVASTDDDSTSVASSKPKKKPEDFESKFNKLSVEHETLQSNFEALQSELSELQSYKRQREEDDIKVKFEGKLSEEEFDKVFAELKDSSFEDIEKELFALIGQKNFSIQQSAEKTNKITIPVRADGDKTSNPYSALEIYINK